MTTATMTQIDHDTVSDDACAVCDHKLADHDAIGARFCRATQAQVLSRNCVCR